MNFVFRGVLKGREDVKEKGGKNAQTVDLPRQGKKRTPFGGGHRPSGSKLQKTFVVHVGRPLVAGCNLTSKLGDASPGECGKFISFWRSSQRLFS